MRRRLIVVAWIVPGFVAPGISAQQWLRVDDSGIGLQNHAVDPERQRLVVCDELTAEVWELDGTVLLPRATMAGFPRPAARDGAAMVFDESRGHMLLFGGRDSSSSLGDTWIRTGDRWSSLPSAVNPAPRWGAAVVFDPVRDRVLMFGGRDQGYLTDTWEHDGAGWTQRLPAVQPVAGSSRMVFDMARGVAVLAVVPPGPAPPQIWEWDGVDWQQRLAVGGGPSPRLGTAFVHDPLRQRSVLLGGSSRGEEIWEWDGSAWTRQGTAVELRQSAPVAWFDPELGRVMVVRRAVPLTAVDRLDLWTWDGVALASRSDDRVPNGRRNSAWFWDSASGSALLFGGVTGPELADTWRWDGVTWQLQNVQPAPPARQLAAFASDHGGARGFLFGGLGGFVMNDFWRWSSTGWTQMPSAGGPGPRLGASMAYDEARGRVVMFGGLYGSAALDETWEWDGSLWARRQPAVAPSPRHQSAMTFDVARGRCVLFGGVHMTYLTDTWEWDGTQWFQAVPLTVPVPGVSRSMAYDRDRQRCVMSAHWGQSGAAARDLWEYDGIDWTLVDRQSTSSPGTELVYDPVRRRLVAYDGAAVLEWTTTPALAAEIGTGCGVFVPRLTVRTRPRIGAVEFGLEAVVAGSGAVLMALSDSLATTPITGGCSVLIGPALASSLVLADARGVATQPIPLPVAPALRGLTLFAQAGALYPTAAIALSPGLAFTIGD